MKTILFTLTMAVSLLACLQQPKLSDAIPQGTTVDKQPGECPFLTKDNEGHAVLSWIRLINDSTTAFCYANSTDGKAFAAPVVVPNSNKIQPHGENLPKIIFKPSGEIIALWGAGNPNPRNKYSGLVFYTQSFDNGKTWTKPTSLVKDTASFDQRYYDVALLSNGEVGIIWLDNRKTTQKAGSGLYFASTSSRNGFGEGRLISQPCCQCCRTRLFVDTKGGIHALFRGILQDSIRDMVHIVSTDDGQTFSEPKRISNDNWVLNACPHTGPAMTENKTGLHFAWYTGANSAGCRYTQTTDNGKTFVQHDSVSAKGSHPQLATLSDGQLMIVWDESKVENDKVYKRIGLQKRTADGKSESKEYLTAQNDDASYPVIVSTKENASIVAYTAKRDGKNQVAYQVIQF